MHRVCFLRYELLVQGLATSLYPATPRGGQFLLPKNNVGRIALLVVTKGLNYLIPFIRMHVPKPRCYVIEFNKTFFTICGFVLRDIPLTTQTVNFSGVNIFAEPISHDKALRVCGTTWEFRLLKVLPSFTYLKLYFLFIT